MSQPIVFARAVAQGIKAGDEVLVIADNQMTIEPATPERIQQAHEALATLAKNEGKNHGG